MIDFFSKEDGDQIIEAIGKAEMQTSGEIRVHLEVSCNQRTFDNAVSVFNKLGMNRTKLKNGVLIFMVPERKEFTILGDSGINNVVPDGFWADVTTAVQEKFKRDRFVEGICDAITRIGEKLKAHFPYDKDDINELPNDISYGK